MPGKSLREQLEAARKVQRQQKQHSDAGADEYDPDALERAGKEIRRLEQQLKEQPAQPKAEPRTEPKPDGHGDPESNANDKVQKAQEELDRLRDQNPETLNDQLQHREDLNEAEQDLAVEQGEQAFDAGGGAQNYTDAEKAKLREIGKDLDKLKAEKAKVDAEIAKYEGSSNQAQSQLDGAVKEGGGPSAASGAAIGASARYLQELNKLRPESTRLNKEIADKLGEADKIVVPKAKAAIERGAERDDLDITLPGAPVNVESAEKKLLDRIRTKLGVDGKSDGGNGILRPRRRRKGGGGGVSKAGDGGPPTLAIATVLVLLVLVVGLVAVFAGGGDGDTEIVADDTELEEPGVDDEPVDEEPVDEEPVDEEPVDEEPVDEEPVDEEPVDEEPTSTEITDPPISGGPWIYVSRIGVGTDPAGHSGPIGMQEQTNLSVQVGSITIEGPPPFVTVSGELAEDGTFSITGRGTVAGFTDVGVKFDGTVTADGLTGEYTMGTGGELPTGEPIVYAVESVGALPPAPDLAEFYRSLSDSLQSGEIAEPLAQLHPAVIERYGSEQCAAYLTDISNPDVNLEFVQVAGVVQYDYPTDDLMTPIGYAYNVDIALTVSGETTATSSNVVVTPSDTTLWFTDCGDPIG